MLDEHETGKAFMMTGRAELGGARRGAPWRLLGWGGAGLLLLLPLAAGAPWTASDFVFAGVMLGSAGLALELIFRKRDAVYRLAAAAAIAAAFMIVWSNAAVGMIGDGDNPYNMLWGGVLLLALAGAAIARFRAAGMAAAMSLAAVAHAAVAAGGYSADPRGALVSLVLAAPWLVSALLFRKAAARA